jgi:two-component system sensor histidine kinase GlrK
MSERLQELDRLKEDYISHLSHTFRTPLTAMGEASEMLHEGPMRVFLSMIQRASRS